MQRMRAGSTFHAVSPV